MTTSKLLYSSDPGLLIGFHGCDEDIRDRIVLQHTMLKSSKNNWDWLGEGMYFWQNNYERAIHYATNPPPKVHIEKPSVLGAVFNLGNCLDLSDQRFINMIQLSYESLKDSALRDGEKLPVNKNPIGQGRSKDKVIRALDCAVLSNVHTITDKTSMPVFDTVRGIFVEGKPVYRGAAFNDKSHLQICIRNPNCIKAFFVPRKQANWP